MALRLLNRNRVSTKSALVAVSLAGALVVGLSRPAAPQDADATIALFERYVEALRRIAHVPGVSAVIVREGRPIWMRGFGFQDVEARAPAMADTLYDIASLTKTFTSTLLLQCVERGTLSLDTPMLRYTTAIAEPGATVRHVLTHSSHGTPGSSYRYDGNRFAALTAVAEACHGMPFRQALAAKILDRLAMADSVPGHDLEQPSAGLAALFDAPSLARYSRSIARLAVPYQTSGHGAARASYPPRDISASAGLLSTVADLAKYDAALDAEIFVSRATQEQAWTGAVSTSGGTLPYGLGWFVQRENGVRLIWHYGLWPQYSALYVKVPERRLTLILLGNSGGLSEASPLADGDVMTSPFAKAFVRLFVR
jgi:CubicO group peptidase (beta-lactamase class C family)